MNLRLSALCVSLALSLASPSLVSAAAEQPSITLSATSGPVGAPVTITGAGFPAGEIVALYIDSPGPYLGLPGPVADAQGAFQLSTKMPGKGWDESGKVNPAKPGPHNICGDTTAYPGSSQPVAARACAQFLVVGPVSPQSAPQGAPITESEQLR